MGLLRGVLAGMSFLAIALGFGVALWGLVAALGGDSLGWCIGAAGVLLIVVALLLLTVLDTERHHP